MKRKVGYTAKQYMDQMWREHPTMAHFLKTEKHNMRILMNRAAKRGEWERWDMLHLATDHLFEMLGECHFKSVYDY